MWLASNISSQSCVSFYLKAIEYGGFYAFQSVLPLSDILYEAFWKNKFGLSIYLVVSRFFLKLI